MSNRFILFTNNRNVNREMYNWLSKSQVKEMDDWLSSQMNHLRKR